MDRPVNRGRGLHLMKSLDIHSSFSVSPIVKTKNCLQNSRVAISEPIHGNLVCSVILKACGIIQIRIISNEISPQIPSELV